MSRCLASLAILTGAILALSACEVETRQPAGGTCLNITHCQSGLACRGGVCGGRNQGSECTADFHCQTGLICTNLVCGGTSGGGGSACETDSHCDNDECNGGVCGGNIDGGTCESNDQCAGGFYCDTDDVSDGIASNTCKAPVEGVAIRPNQSLDPSIGAPTGIAAIEGILYVVDQTTAALYTLNIETGASARVGTATQFEANEGGPSGLAAMGTTLYMVGQQNGLLYTLDTDSGVATPVDQNQNGFGVDEDAPTALAAAPGIPDVDLYLTGLANRALYVLNATTGTARQVGGADEFGITTIGAGEARPAGLVAIDDILYMVEDATDILYELNTDTGVATRIGSASKFTIDEDMPSGLAIDGNNNVYMIGMKSTDLYILHVIPPVNPNN